MNFADKLMDQIDKKKSHVCVGLDPRLDRIPARIKEKAISEYGETLKAVAESFIEFNHGIIDAIKDYVPVIKPQIAFYEQYGYLGVKAFEETITYARQQGLLVIADAKRNDIGSTAQAYAAAYLGEPDFWQGKKLENKIDALTVTPYLGSDGIKPFINTCHNSEEGIFVLVKTSNPSSVELQDLRVEDEIRIYHRIAQLVNQWGLDLVGERGYSSVGAVIGATYPREAERLRGIMKENYFLVPGYGAQGGSAKDIISCFNNDGYGAIINSSREINYAYQKEEYSDDYKEAAQEAVINMRDNINITLKSAGKLAWKGWI